MSAIRAYICTGVFTLSLFQPVIARGCLAADVAQAHVALHALAIAPACIAPTASAGGHLHDDVIGAQRHPRGLAAKARGGVDRLAALAQAAGLRRGAPPPPPPPPPPSPHGGTIPRLPTIDPSATWSRMRWSRRMPSPPRCSPAPPLSWRS